MRPLVSSLKSFGVKNIKGKTNADDQSHDKEHDNDEEYNPEEEIDIQSDDTSEKLKVVEKKKLAQGPRTRSRANISSTLKDAIRKDTLKKDATRKEPNKARKHKENEVTSSYRPPALKPTCSKVLKQVENGVATGSVFAYLVLRECQKKGIEITPAPESALELNLEKSTAEVEKEAVWELLDEFNLKKLDLSWVSDEAATRINEQNEPLQEETGRMKWQRLSKDLRVPRELPAFLQPHSAEGGSSGQLRASRFFEPPLTRLSTCLRPMLNSRLPSIRLKLRKKKAESHKKVNESMKEGMEAHQIKDRGTRSWLEINRSWLKLERLRRPSSTTGWTLMNSRG
ncbi:uncharacterized protein LOC135149500 [Daucus carota subsp. sativus]|uniref:uncharacterized protein LOC135149500 n=1 Tax=Daucus carota subsp. sativus TaxID=79200 RepID=UPI003082B2D9